MLGKVRRSPITMFLLACAALAATACSLPQSSSAAEPPASSGAEVVNIVRLRAVAGKEAQLGEALKKLLTATRNEPGCAAIYLHQSADETNLWMVYERWRGEEGLATHMKTAHVAEFLGQVEQLTNGAVEVKRFNPRL